MRYLCNRCRINFATEDTGPTPQWRWTEADGQKENDEVVARNRELRRKSFFAEERLRERRTWREGGAASCKTREGASSRMGGMSNCQSKAFGWDFAKDTLERVQ